MSKLNCWPGCLAVMVRSDFPANVGKLFEVLDTYRCERREWRVKTITGCEGSWSGHVPAGTIAWAFDADLRPITPPADSVSTDEVIELYSPDKTPVRTTEDA